MSQATDFEAKLTQTPVIATNTLVGLLTLLIVPPVGALLLESGIPVGVSEGIYMGVLLAVFCFPFVFLTLAYYGYTEGK
jgi:hypothetical protein